MMDDRIAQLRKHNAAFERLLSFIPAKFYLAEDPNKIVQAEPVAGLSKKKKRAAAEQARAEIKEAAKKAKRAKYDPATPRTVLELQAAKLAALVDDKPSKKKQQESSTEPQPSISELRERLHAKIASLSAASKVAPTVATESSTREALIQQTQKERLAQQEQDVLSKKQAKKLARKQFQQALDAAAAKKAKRSPSPSLPLASASGMDIDDSAALVPSTSAPTPSASTDLAFSTLDFANADTVKPMDVLKRSKVKSAKADPKAALAKLNDRKKFLDKLTPASRERAEEKDKWNKVEKKLGGEKVWDEEAKLKKMVKRKDKERRQSKKDWNDREEDKSKAEADKQKKRTDNLNARIQQKKDKKTGGGKKSGASKGKKTQSRGFERSSGAPSSKYKSGAGNRGGGLKGKK